MAARWPVLVLVLVVLTSSACSLISITGPLCPQGEICFGTDIDPQTYQLIGRTNVFEVGQPMASLIVVGSFGEGQVLVESEFSIVDPDGTETAIFGDKSLSRPLPQHNLIGGKGDISQFLSGPGMYVERLTVAPYGHGGPLATPFLTAEGRFQLVPSSSAGP